MVNLCLGDFFFFGRVSNFQFRTSLLGQAASRCATKFWNPSKISSYWDIQKVLFGILRKLNSSGGKWRVYCKSFLLLCSCFLRLNIFFYFQKLQDEMRGVLKTFSIELTDYQVLISYVFLAKQRNNPSLFHALGGVAFFYPLSLKCTTHTHDT
jgi:hypothetical protein